MVINTLLHRFGFNRNSEHAKPMSLPILPLEVLTKIFFQLNKLDFSKCCLLNKQWKELTSEEIQKWKSKHTIKDLDKEIPIEIKKSLQKLSVKEKDRLIVLLTGHYSDDFEVDPTILDSKKKDPTKVTWFKFNRLGKKANF